MVYFCFLSRLIFVSSSAIRGRNWDFHSVVALFVFAEAEEVGVFSGRYW